MSGRRPQLRTRGHKKRSLKHQKQNLGDLARGGDMGRPPRGSRSGISLTPKWTIYRFEREVDPACERGP